MSFLIDWKEVRTSWIQHEVFAERNRCRFLTFSLTNFNFTLHTRKKWNKWKCETFLFLSPTHLFMYDKFQLRFWHSKMFNFKIKISIVFKNKTSWIETKNTWKFCYSKSFIKSSFWIFNEQIKLEKYFAELSWFLKINWYESAKLFICWYWKRRQQFFLMPFFLIFSGTFYRNSIFFIPIK